MTDNVLRSAAGILGTVLKNEPWLDIGYGKRPKYGTFFRNFRPKWRVDLEDSLLKEMTSIFTAAYVLAGVLEEEDLDQVINVYVDGPTDGPGITSGPFRTFGFLSRKDALTYFDEAIREYIEPGPSNWSGILTRRIGITRIPDQKLSAKLMGGSIRFTQTVEGMVLALRLQHQGGQLRTGNGSWET